MWNLTRSIYRYIGSPVATWDANEHTVDEKMSVDSHLAVIAWIHTMIQNAVSRVFDLAADAPHAECDEHG